jgi:hypothetical protein
MKRKFFPQIFFNAPDGGGGAAPPAAGAPAATPTGTPPAAAPAAGAVGAPPAPGGATPPAPQAGQPQATPPAAGTEDYWPTGLDQSFKGADSKATLDNLAKALNGYRTRDAQKGVPEKPEAYADVSTLKDFVVEDAFKPHFEALKADPAFAAISKTAHAHGVGHKAFAEIFQSGLTAMSENGLLLPEIDVAAEKAALVPAEAKALPAQQQEVAVQKRLNENYAFLDLMEANRGLPKEVRQYMEVSLMDGAKGHQAIEWMRAQIQGGGAQGGTPGAHGQAPGGRDTKDSLRAARAAINPGDPQRAQKEAELDRRYQELYGD